MVYLTKKNIFACKNKETASRAFFNAYRNNGISNELSDYLDCIFADGTKRGKFDAARLPIELLSNAKPLREFLGMFGHQGNDFSVLLIEIGDYIFDEILNGTESPSSMKGIVVPLIFPNIEFLQRVHPVEFWSEREEVQIGIRIVQLLATLDFIDAAKMESKICDKFVSIYNDYFFFN